MASHSSVLAWRIPGMREPGGLPSMGLYRVGHDWSDLAAAAAAMANDIDCLFMYLFATYDDSSVKHLFMYFACFLFFLLDCSNIYFLINYLVYFTTLYWSCHTLTWIRHACFLIRFFNCWILRVIYRLTIFVLWWIYSLQIFSPTLQLVDSSSKQSLVQSKSCLFWWSLIYQFFLL